MRDTGDWAFLTRFCFLSDRGRLEFEFEFPKEYEPQNILLYYDEPDQWPAVYKSDLNCSEREAVATRGSYQSIRLSQSERWSECSQVTLGASTRIHCNSYRKFRSSRERWWFIALSKCRGNTQGLNLAYKMTMTNAKDDVFYKHFSADEFYILQVDIAFLMAQTVLLSVSIACAVALTNRQLLHSTYKMYMISLVFEVLHLLFMCIGYGNYANNGLADVLYGFKTFARILEAVSLLTFILMLILMAKGFTITRGRISTSGSIKVAIFMTLYSITYAVLFIYEAHFFDPGEVLYIYESPGGYGLLAMRLIGWAWFCYAVFFTLKHYPEKSKFYFPFFAFYTLWFWAGPVIILVAMKVMELWVREKVVNAVELAVTFIGHLFFLILTRPSAANVNFPYHVRTSQIGIMANPEGGYPHTGAPTTADRASESFAPHSYAPTNPEYVTAGGPNFTELFTVSNTQANGTTARPGNKDYYSNNNPPPYSPPYQNAANQQQQNGGFPHQTTANPFVVTK